MLKVADTRAVELGLSRVREETVARANALKGNIISSSFERTDLQPPFTNNNKWFQEMVGDGTGNQDTWPAAIDSGFPFSVNADKQIDDYMEATLVAERDHRGAQSKILLMESKLDDPDQDVTSRIQYHITNASVLSDTWHMDCWLKFDPDLIDNLNVDPLGNWRSVTDFHELPGSDRRRINVYLAARGNVPNRTDVVWRFQLTDVSKRPVIQWTIDDDDPANVPLDTWFRFQFWYRSTVGSARAAIAVDGVNVLDTDVDDMGAGETVEIGEPYTFAPIKILMTPIATNAGVTFQRYSMVDVWSSWPVNPPTRIQNMGTITKENVTEMKNDYFQLGRGKEEFKGPTNPRMHGGQLRDVFQAIEDFWVNSKAALKADIDAAAGKTLTNAQARVLGRAWLRFKAGRGG